MKKELENTFSERHASSSGTQQFEENGNDKMKQKTAQLQGQIDRHKKEVGCSEKRKCYWAKAMYVKWSAFHTGVWSIRGSGDNTSHSGSGGRESKGAMKIDFGCVRENKAGSYHDSSEAAVDFLCGRTPLKPAAPYASSVDVAMPTFGRKSWKTKGMQRIDFLGRLDIENALHNGRGTKKYYKGTKGRSEGPPEGQRGRLLNVRSGTCRTSSSKSFTLWLVDVLFLRTLRRKKLSSL
nr:unnamed protein product [Callosobruchus chinensis]